ncbi:WD domain protein [Paecilomyces variotii No. 5]|uniref:WD domain protein n=1 Tax=Byssochlamys spectabilis (strain No. 5 / NBRC 109023) TaxID=1356009 RepID=V5G2V6_BYSSN|nr:WD domain protein [Paecilomyces variotii No. 5]
MNTLKAAGSSTLNLPKGSYIYSISASTPDSFAAISSDDSLRTFDSNSLKLLSVPATKTHEEGVTCLKEYGQATEGGPQLLATAGRDGKVKLWDVRSGSGKGQPVVEMETGKFELLKSMRFTMTCIGIAKHVPVLSLACSAATNTVVAGTELASYQAAVVFWDIRSPKEPRLQYVESHNDDVTELQFHPLRNDIVLSGSTDGLVNIYDTNIADEEDALIQVINHGSVHHAGYLSENAIYALSHDETFSIHPITNPDDPAQEPSPIQFGDVRQSLGCEYVVQILGGSQGTYVAAGNTTQQKLDLVPLVPNPKWRFDQENIWRLPGAHGEEIVRSIYLDEKSQAVFTGGEDGVVVLGLACQGRQNRQCADGAATKMRPESRQLSGQTGVGEGKKAQRRAQLGRLTGRENQDGR